MIPVARLAMAQDTQERCYAISKIETFIRQSQSATSQSHTEWEN